MATRTNIARGLVEKVGISVADIPTFLCPGILRVSRPIRHLHTQRPRFSTASQRRDTRSITSSSPASPPTIPKAPTARPHATSVRRLPQQCSGCGALSQTVDKEGPGYFSLKRRAVKEYLEDSPSTGSSSEGRILKEALERASSEGIDLDLGDVEKPARVVEAPVCERCHKLRHHESGVSIHHPSIQDIEDTIAESPYKYNHVYHVLDAADFPMSLIPGLHKRLGASPLRSLNRRSKTGRFSHGRKTQISFIITRADLLAPLKTQVDSKMPYLRAVLRDALGRSGNDMRLGNVHCVSAKANWWTKELCQDIYRRGGAGWMVGKVNVGKSQLFSNVFPKGRTGTRFSKEAVLNESGALNSGVGGKNESMGKVNKNMEDAIEETEAETEEARHEAEEADRTAMEDESESPRPVERASTADSELRAASDDFDSLVTSLDASSLLPPVQPEIDYPTMPLVSSLPGTTASPIRLRFGNGKGELIDLPGLSRGDLELYVQPEHRPSLVMRSRVTPEQQTIKPGQSLLLGGFIRITPTTPDLTFLAYAFTPLEAHRTSTEKAIGTQEQTRESKVENIALPGTGERIASAGTFPLKWDVTRQRAGPITARDAVGIKPARLPFRVMSVDILIEGCGWVELVCQIRKRPGATSALPTRDWDPAWEMEPHPDADADPGYIDPSWPAVEVFSPEGRFVAARRPLNAWLCVANKPLKGTLQGRPRKSMKGAKKLEKKKKRRRDGPA